MNQADRKSYLYKNQTPVTQQRISSTLNYNKVPFQHRKEAEYQRNLDRYYPKDSPGSSASPSPQRKGQVKVQTKGTRAVIEISNKGVRANEKIIEFELNNKKGKNVGHILNSRQRSMEKDLTKSKLSNISPQN